MAKVSTAADIGARIRAAREAKGLTAEQLGEKIGTDKGTVSRIERGLAGLDVERLQEIANALGVPVEDLIRSKPRSPVASARIDRAG